MVESPGVSGAVQGGGPRLCCESCGYDIANIVTGGRCPECGLAVAESMPERRIGTAWQRGRGLGGYSEALIGGIIRPANATRCSRPAMWRNTELYLLNCFLSAAGPTVVLMLAPVIWTHRFDDHHGARTLRALPGSVVAIVVVTLIISFVALVVFYGAWVVASLTTRRFDSEEGSIAASIASCWLTWGATVCAVSMAATFIVGPVAMVVFAVGFLGGWIGYAVACYRGLRALRFANMPKAGPFDFLPPTIPSNEPTPSNPSHLSR